MRSNKRRMFTYLGTVVTPVSSGKALNEHHEWLFRPKSSGKWYLRSTEAEVKQVIDEVGKMGSLDCRGCKG